MEITESVVTSQNPLYYLSTNRACTIMVSNMYKCFVVRINIRHLDHLTETKMSSFWRNFNHWLHWKLSFWQLPVQPVMKISSKWRHFRFSACSLMVMMNSFSALHKYDLEIQFNRRDLYQTSAFCGHVFTMKLLLKKLHLDTWQKTNVVTRCTSL